MAGQVKHRQIFSDVVPDLKLMGLLARLAFKNTDSLIGAVADALEREGIVLLPSTALLADQMAREGAMTRRRPGKDELKSVEYGVRIARLLAGNDLGQTAVVKDRAAVALEAMEGTDETIRRAGRIAGPGTSVVKVAKPRQDPRFDVPVVGAGTLDAMREAGAHRPGDRGGPHAAHRQGRLPRRRRCGRARGVGLRPGERGLVKTRVAVVGVGALGQHHARVYAGLSSAELVGIYDVEPARSREVAERHGCPVLAHLRDVVDAADAVSVAVPTVDHHRVVRALLDAGKDVLVEKPIAATLDEADDLVRLARRKGPGATGRPRRAVQPGGGPASGRTRESRASSRSIGWRRSPRGAWTSTSCWT